MPAEPSATRRPPSKFQGLPTRDRARTEEGTHVDSVEENNTGPVPVVEKWPTQVDSNSQQPRVIWRGEIRHMHRPARHFPTMSKTTRHTMTWPGDHERALPCTGCRSSHE